MTTTIRLLLALGAVTVQGLGLTARPGKAETRTFYATQGLSPPAAAGSLCYTHCPLSSPASGRGPLTVLRADRFGAPAESAGPPSVLEVARPLMDAAKGLEMAGTTVVSFCGDDRALFDGGTQLVCASACLRACALAYTAELVCVRLCRCVYVSMCGHWVHGRAVCRRSRCQKKGGA